jgi:hypothetical protein
VGGDNVFTAMPGLRWDEITITFTELEAARVKARGKAETLTYGVMGFRDRKRHTAKPNMLVLIHGPRHRQHIRHTLG